MKRCLLGILAGGVLAAASCSPRAAAMRSEKREETEAQADSRIRQYYGDIPASVEEMLPRIRAHAAALAALGPRQTGQEGCRRAFEYVRSALEEMGLGGQIKEFSSEVTVPLDRTRPEELTLAEEPFSHLAVEGIGDRAQTWPAHAFMPNCVQACRTHPMESCPLRGQEGAWPCPNCERPRRLVDLSWGRWEDFRGKDLTGSVVLLEFNSGDAWLRAASLGAAGALFIEPNRTTVFQADKKYLATLPLHVPRLYVTRRQGEVLRRALAEAPEKLRVTLKSRLRFRNVPARGLELTIPGKNREICFVLASHLDAHCIVPDLSYGAAEVWGIAELIELTRYFLAHQPAHDIQVMFVSGHWQSQQAMRDWIAADREGSHFRRIGHYYRIAMGVDLDPVGRSVNLISESAWDNHPLVAYRWLGNQLFRKDGWREEIFRAFEPGTDVELFGGIRPIMSETLDGPMATRNDRSPFMYAPRYHTAEEAWQALGITTFAFQTGRLSRLVHNTPLDRLQDRPAETVDHQLRPQLQITLAVLRNLLDYPAQLLPKFNPGTRGGRSWGGYAQVTGRVMQWDRSIGWFAARLPGELDAVDTRAPAQPSSQAASGPRQREDLETFLYAYATDSVFTNLIGARLRNYLYWPLSPSRGVHRELQSFMFQDLRLLDRSDFRLNTVYAAYPETRYDVVGYSIDPAGRIRYATDYGTHGDGNKAFQCTDVDLDTWNLYVPVSLFECGTLELFDLLDPQRYNPNAEVFGSYFQSYISHGDLADRGIPPYLRVEGIKDINSHTDLERWGFTQYGPTAMVFLPANFQMGAEVLLGTYFTDFAVLNNPGPSRPDLGAAVGERTAMAVQASGSEAPPAEMPAGQAGGQEAATQPAGGARPRGYRFQSGQTLRLSRLEKPTPLACLEQLTTLNQQRMAEFAQYDVASPLAKGYHADSLKALRAGIEAQRQGEYDKAQADYLRAWMFESLAYRNTLRLLLDVVSTTVLYFVLLIPFSFLMERLLFPQRTALRTALVAVGIFAFFAAVLYLFHPGFKLAHNVVVTTTAFVIVVMTIPALILLLVRGVAMLRAIGSKRVITQQSEAESAGVVMAALSLAVSNMRRRRLRTALTLITITTLVVALVLLTTSSAFDFKILEPTGMEGASIEGVQVYNARDRRQPLLTEMVEVYEAALRDQALVVRRETINYGYDHKSDNGSLYLRAGSRKTRVPFFQVMDARDDLVTYYYPFTESLQIEGRQEPVRVAQAVPIHLSDLFRQRYQGTGSFLEPPRFNGQGEFLAEGDVDVCLLPNNIAEELAVKVGDTVTLMGLPLRVKGIFSAQTVTQQQEPDGTVKDVFLPGPMDRLTDLDGLPMTAMRASKWREGEADKPLHAPSNEIVIVPREWVRRYAIFPSNVYSMIVIPQGAQKDSEAISAWAAKLGKEILNVDVFSHYRAPKIDPATGAQEVARYELKDDAGLLEVPQFESHSNRISMLTATQVKGSTLMLVVLAVAVLMILAIMTGTVYERMREIHIFSSVGLSPRHVAGMFLIEALVYAGIAAVLGYFLGIVALKGLLWHLKATGQHQEFYPNYLGVFVLYSIGIAVLATVASSLYPIRLASKIVNPSAGSGWKLESEGTEEERAHAEQLGHWRVRLPFIATTWDEARAMMVYAYDYLAMHQGERSGRFVCQSPPAGHTGLNTLGLVVPVWLAPFERNLTQHSTLRARPTAQGDWWELSLDLKRLSGPPYLFKRGVTVFIDMLCKHLLRWRAATAAQEADCLQRAEQVYGKQQ